MWSIQILWADKWVTVQNGFVSRGDAEWATGIWKQTNHCTGDPFRAIEEESAEDAHLRDLIRGRTDLG